MRSWHGLSFENSACCGISKLRHCHADHNDLGRFRIARGQSHKCRRSRSARTCREHRARAEGPRTDYSITPIREQVAEHRKRVLSKLGSPGMIFVQPSLDDLAAEYGTDSCAYLTDLKNVISQHFKDLPIQLLHAKDKAALVQFAPEAAEQKCEELASLQQAVTACRAIKSTADIACLLHASAVSASGHMAMWRNCKPGMHEYQLEAEFLRATMRQGLCHTAYPSIVAAGNSAATLHYERNNAVVGQDDLILVDAGAEYRCFAADISRTFPASGKFTSAQQDLYNAVLEVQEHAISCYQSGRGWKEEVAMPSRQRYCELLQDLGLAKGSVDALLDNNVDKIFMPHSLGHFLGMDVHDVSPSGPVPDQLKPGHVVTCEPGLYFVQHMLESAYCDSKKREFLNRDGIDQFRPFGGIRIEDDILVKSDGNFNLTEAVGMVKTVDEIESVYSKDRFQ